MTFDVTFKPLVLPQFVHLGRCDFGPCVESGGEGKAVGGVEGQRCWRELGHSIFQLEVMSCKF